MKKSWIKMQKKEKVKENKRDRDEKKKKREMKKMKRRMRRMKMMTKRRWSQSQKIWEICMLKEKRKMKQNTSCVFDQDFTNVYEIFANIEISSFMIILMMQEISLYIILNSKKYFLKRDFRIKIAIFEEANSKSTRSFILI